MQSKKYRDYLKRSFIQYAVIIIAIMFVLFIGFMIINIQFTTIHVNDRNRAEIETVLDTQMNAIQKNIMKLSADKSVKTALIKSDSENITAANLMLYDFTNSQQLKTIFVLLDTDGNICCTNLFENNKQVFLQSAMIVNVIDKLEANTNAVYNCVSRLNYDNGQTGDLLFAKAVTLEETVIGYLFVDMCDDSLSNYIRNYPLDKVIITDHFDNIIFTTLRPLSDSIGNCSAGKFRMERTNKNMVTLDGSLYYAGFSKLNYNAIQLHTLTSMEPQRQMILFGTFFLVIISFMLVLAVCLLSDMAVKRNLRSVEQLVEAVSQISEGNIGYKIHTKTFDEFQYLFDTFNGMTARLEDLIQKNDTLSESKRIMEVKQLEAQFNPHFVYNVIEALRYEIIMDPKRASEILVSFARLMRYSINYGDIKVPLRIDIEYINDYLILQKMRYNQRLEYDIDIPDNLLNYRIPKLLIQPIVENCFNHGTQEKRFIEIKIEAVEINHDLELRVTDNGNGIQKHELIKIRENLEKEHPDPNHIGLYNVHRALRLQCGPEYGLTIHSLAGCGTEVTLKMSIEKDELNV